MIGLSAVLALVAIFMISGSPTGGAISNTGYCQRTLSERGTLGMECGQGRTVGPMFRLRPGGLLFVPSSTQVNPGFGAGQGYRTRMLRQDTRDRMAHSGGERSGMIIRSSGNEIFDQNLWFSRNPSRRAYGDVRIAENSR